ncbi:hypothetical protein HOD08_02070 [bacterium]|nr:hypothetical protein [bacterium]
MKFISAILALALCSTISYGQEFDQEELKAKYQEALKVASEISPSQHAHLLGAFELIRVSKINTDELNRIADHNFMAKLDRVGLLTTIPQQPIIQPAIQLAIQLYTIASGITVSIILKAKSLLNKAQQIDFEDKQATLDFLKMLANNWDTYKKKSKAEQMGIERSLTIIKELITCHKNDSSLVEAKCWFDAKSKEIKQLKETSKNLIDTLVSLQHTLIGLSKN